MGGPSIKTAGGGAAKGGADDFSNWIAQGLNNGVFGGTNQAMGMNGAINNMMAGQGGANANSQQYFGNMGGNGGIGGVPMMQNMYNPQNFNAAQFMMPNMQQPGNTGGANYGQVNAQFNPTQINPNFNSNNPALTQGLGTQANLNDVTGSAKVSPYQQAMSDMLQRQHTRDIADLRARYGPTGGTPAAYAEGNYRAEAGAQDATALGQIGMNEQNLGLTQRSQDLSNFTNSRGMDINQLGMMAQNNQFGANLGVNAAQMNNSNMANAAGIQLQGQGMNAGNALQNQGMINSNAYNYSNLGQMGINNLNQLMLGQSQGQNQFNLNNAGNFANYGNATQMGNIANMFQNQGMMNQFGLGQANVGLGLQGLNLQGQNDALSQLMASMRQTQQIGTPQAQSYAQPSGFQNFLSGANALAGTVGAWKSALSPYGGSGGSGQQNMPMPMNFPGYNIPSMSSFAGGG